MRLSSLLPSLQSAPAFTVAIEAIEGVGRRPPGAPAPTVSVISPARSFALAALHARLRRPMVLVTARPGDARTYAAELRAWVDDPAAVFHFPETDALPYDYLPGDVEKRADRLAALRRLAGIDRGDTPPIVVAPVRAALDFLMDVESFQQRHRCLRRGEAVAPQALAAELLALGYEPSMLVDQPGLFGRRGGILDVFPPGGEALRIEFWGDEIDTIRTFDPATQRSLDQLGETVIGPAHEVLPGPLPESIDLSPLRPQFRETFERDRRHLAEGQAFSALGFYRGALGSAVLVDYVPQNGLLVLEEPAAVVAVDHEFEEQVEGLHADLLERGELPAGLPRPYARLHEARRSIERSGGQVVYLDFDPDAESLPFQHAPRFAGQVDAFLKSAATAAERERVVVVSQQAERLSAMLHERGVEAADSLASVSSERGLAVLHGLLQEGWRSEPLGLDLFTDGEVFGWTKQRRAPAPRRTVERAVAQRDAFIADLKPGDLVVHVDHGIAKFGGLVRTPIGYSPGDTAPALEQAPPGYAEFLVLDYAEGDRLYVPVSQADRVERYVGSGDVQPSLTRLGSGEWARAKAKVRRSVRDIAHELMDLYAARQSIEGNTFSLDTAWQSELEASFPYLETPDQAQAIRDVKSDMERGRPMDRLLVGDVGFGKTEVALRAAFKAVQDGKQVAVLVPTTVLAQQHYSTFRDRLASFPVRVEMLSRFRSEKEQHAILRGLASGAVDICIGTHRLVQKDVRFKDLGLVVIDEEQRFGVAHKERLKQLRREVDVLTLTATPIPRTLHMGLVGVRDMSVLETPPEARLPVRTYVQEYDDGLVREAIAREIDRGGQVYFVHNRVQGIESVAARVRKLVPEARVGIGHGQMPEEQLEQTMLAFAEGEFDVLVCTTIIESGLDIANANTLIVNNAHRFGLAQLYQLRGRVGRGPTRAYAYFLYTQDLALSEVASQRLKTIFEATELGAGLRIAMRDLEIRGAGNLLGAAQSGHIAAVGFDLYTRLLAEQVELLQARQRAADGGPVRLPNVRVEPSIDLPLEAFIPPEYVTDDPVRLRLYQRLASLDTDVGLSALVAEMEDRFGALPEPAQNLVYLTSLRLRAAEAGVVEIAATDQSIVLRFDRTPPLALERLERAAGTRVWRGSNQLRFAAGEGSTWMGRLYAVVENLTRRAA